MVTKAKKPVDIEPVCASAAVVSANLNTLMKAYPDLSSNLKLDKKTKIGTGAISRARNGQNLTLITMEALAKAFDLEVWQLLVPGLDPANAPVLGIAGKKEQELYKRFRTAAKEILQIDQEPT
ncbi:MAG: hypothetical protein V4718_04295 [Pseudomonadota bacterium]